MSDEREINVHIKSSTQGLTDGLAHATHGVEQAVKQMETHFSGLGSAVSNLMGPFKLLGELLVGGAIFEKLIEETAHLGVELERMSQKTGMSVEALGELKFAAATTHTDFEGVATGLNKMARSMEAAAKGAGPAADAYRSMGVAVKDASGHLRGESEVLNDLAEKFASYKDGPEKAALAMQLFGRAGADLIPMLNKGKEGLKESAAEAHALGGVMSKDGVEKSELYAQAMNRLKTSLAGVGRYVAEQVMPILTALADLFTAAIVTIRFNISAIDQLLEASIHSAKVWAGSIGDAIDALLSGDFTGAKAAMDRGSAELGKTWTGTFAQIKREAHEANDEIGRLGVQQHEDEHKQTRQAPAVVDHKADRDAYEAKLEQFKLEEIAAKDNADALVAIAERRVAYVQAMARKEVATKKEVIAAEEQLATARQNVVERNLRETVADATAARAIALQRIAAERSDLQTRAALTHMHRDDELRAEQALADREYALACQALLDEAKLEEARPVQHAAILRQLAVLDAQHKTKTVENANATTLAVASRWESIAATIGQSFTQNFTMLIDRMGSLKDVWLNVAAQIEHAVIASGVRILAAHIFVEKGKTAVTAQSTDERLAIELAGHVKSLAMSVAHALKEIAIHAAKAMAAAFSAIAGIPFVGPFLAPAAAGVAGAAVLGFGARIASAEGGFDIPAGVNPMTQLHQREMVLPAPLADRVRAMTGDGGGGGDTHVTIHAVDAQSFLQFAKRQPEAFAAGVKAAVRGGHLAMAGG